MIWCYMSLQTTSAEGGVPADGERTQPNGVESADYLHFVGEIESLPSSGANPPVQERHAGGVGAAPARDGIRFLCNGLPLPGKKTAFDI